MLFGKTPIKLNMKDNFNLTISISIKILILILLLICIFNGSTISDYIYSLNSDGFSEFEGLRTYISVQVIFSILSILDVSFIAIDYYRILVE